MIMFTGLFALLLQAEPAQDKPELPRLPFICKQGQRFTPSFPIEADTLGGSEQMITRDASALIKAELLKSKKKRKKKPRKEDEVIIRGLVETKTAF